MDIRSERLGNVDPATVGQAMQAMLGLEAVVARSGQEQLLLDLVKTRASQMNRCAYCLDMHTKSDRQ